MFNNKVLRCLRAQAVIILILYLKLDKSYWNQGCFLTHFSLKPASDLTLMEAASAAFTVSFTAWLSFWALPMSMSMASWSSSVSMLLFIMVAFTVDITLSWVPSVGIFSQTWRRLVLIFLSVQCRASSLARSVILSEASVKAFAQ